MVLPSSKKFEENLEKILKEEFILKPIVKGKTLLQKLKSIFKL